MRQEEKDLMLEAQRKAATISHEEVSRHAQVIKELTPEEEMFCREFAVTKDRRKAMEAAGYKGKNPSMTAARWLAKPRIRNRLQSIVERKEARVDISKEIYLNMLQETYDRAMADGDYAGANRASELLGKALGYFVEQKAVLNVSARMPEDRTQQIEEVKRLAKIAGVSFE